MLYYVSRIIDRQFKIYYNDMSALSIRGRMTYYKSSIFDKIKSNWLILSLIVLFVLTCGIYFFLSNFKDANADFSIIHDTTRNVSCSDAYLYNDPNLYLLNSTKRENCSNWFFRLEDKSNSENLYNFALKNGSGASSPELAAVRYYDFVPNGSNLDTVQYKFDHVAFYHRWYGYCSTVYNGSYSKVMSVNYEYPVRFPQSGTTQSGCDLYWNETNHPQNAFYGCYANALKSTVNDTAAAENVGATVGFVYPYDTGGTSWWEANNIKPSFSLNLQQSEDVYTLVCKNDTADADWKSDSSGRDGSIKYKQFSTSWKAKSGYKFKNVEIYDVWTNWSDIGEDQHKITLDLNNPKISYDSNSSLGVTDCAMLAIFNFEEIKPDHLEVYATKTSYKLNESINPDTLSVNLVYNDGTKSALSYKSGYNINPVKLTSAGSSIPVEISYAPDYYAVNPYLLQVRVMAPQRLEVTPPTKRNYLINEELDTTGMIVNLVYDNDEKEVLSYPTDYNYTPQHLTEAGRSIKITVSDNKSVVEPFDFFVDVKKPVSLKVEPPTKTKYIVGEDLDTSGMKVFLVYDNNDEEEIFYPRNYDYNPKTLDTEGTQKILVSYIENKKDLLYATEEEFDPDATFDVSVVAKSVPQESIKEEPESFEIFSQTLDNAFNLIIILMSILFLSFSLKYILSNKDKKSFKDWY